MPDDDTTSVVTEEAAPAAEAVSVAPAEKVHCRHCGQAFVGEVPDNGDFLCPSCERYQDSMLCPTCNSVVRISLMPDGSAPEVHAPVRSRKTKGDE